MLLDGAAHTNGRMPSKSRPPGSLRCPLPAQKSVDTRGCVSSGGGAQVRLQGLCRADSAANTSAHPLHVAPKQELEAECEIARVGEEETEGGESLIQAPEATDCMASAVSQCTPPHGWAAATPFTLTILDRRRHFGPGKCSMDTTATDSIACELQAGHRACNRAQTFVRFHCSSRW